MAQQDVLDYIRKTPHNSNVNVVKGMLDSLGGSSLPEVTNEDNGKVLTVVEGEWNKAAGGGSAEPLIVNVIDNTMDKTFGEIRQAFDNDGYLLVAQDESYDDTTGVRMTTVRECYYSITGGEYPSASGGVILGNGEYSVNCDEAPYTLEALDAQYPYMAD